MPPRGALIKTARGNTVTRNPARVMFAADTMRNHGNRETARRIVKRFGIHIATARADVRAAKQLIALELDAIEVRAAEALRNERIADQAERMAKKAARAGEFSAAAALQKSAIAASMQIARLTGAYAPTKVEIQHSGSVEVDIKIDAALSVLDEADLAALRIINAKVLAAMEDGRIAAPADDEDEDVEDAEIVDEPGPGEN